MSKLIMLSGLPASGKSTKAKEIIEVSGNYYRLNYDLLRMMLHFDKYSPHNEQITQDLADNIAKMLLISGKNVIIDNCNLGQNHKAHWSNIAYQHSAKFEVVSLTDVPWNICITRDLLRKTPVGDHVILKMALQYKLADPGPKVVICDLDGTLCDTTWRQEHVRKEPKDWEAFYQGIPNDVPRHEVLEIYFDYLHQGCTGILVSGRPEKYREITEKWLHIWSIPSFVVLMRENHDARPDDIVKKQILDTYLTKENVIAVIDDRRRVLKMWEENLPDAKIINVGGEDNDF